MDSTTLNTLQSALRRLVPESIGDTINEIKKHLPDFCPKYNALLLLESRLNDANLQRIEGTISDEDLQLRYNQIRADLLLFINGLAVNDFSLPAAGTPTAKTGSLLYKIPTRMTLQKETKCVIRLAFEKASIIRNIELDSDVEIKSVRIAEVMQVELIDPTEPHPFAIRSISDEEQFVEKGDYSEWVFYVKPLQKGTFPLVLKISVIEIVMGKERLRNLTYEEHIEILATAEETVEPEFKPTGLTITPNIPETAGSAAPDSPPPPPQTAEMEEIIDLPSAEEMIPFSPDAPMPAPVRAFEPKKSVQQPKVSRRRSMLPMLATAASVLLVLTVSIFYITSNKSTNEFIDVPSNIVADSLSIIPDTLYRDSMITDSLDLQ